VQSLVSLRARLEALLRLSATSPLMRMRLEPTIRALEAQLGVFRPAKAPKRRWAERVRSL